MFRSLLLKISNNKMKILIKVHVIIKSTNGKLLFYINNITTIIVKIK